MDQTRRPTYLNGHPGREGGPHALWIPGAFGPDPPPYEAYSSNPLPSYAPLRPRNETRREYLTRLAKDTMSTAKKGAYVYRQQTISLKEYINESEKGTIFYDEDSELKNWKRKPNSKTQGDVEAMISILNITTLDAARLLDNSYRFHAQATQPNSGIQPAPPKTGVLNFASATKAGGGFLNGAEAQEESIARVSTLYPSLCTKEAKKFYTKHDEKRRDATDFYTHSMIYSPGVAVFRNDLGDAVDPYFINVVSCAAVNAGKVSG